MKKIKDAEQAYHFEGPYAHFIVHPRGVQEYPQQLMKILDISSQDLAPGNTESFFDIFNSIDDFPVMTRPYSNITHHIIKDEKDSNNPYQVITKNAELLHKLIHLHQYGVSTQPIDRDTLYIHNHSRYEHSLDTALNIELIMRNNGFSEADIRKGIVAGCLHDVATPVFGDLTMKAFPQIREEFGFPKYMANYPAIVSAMEKNFHVSINELHGYIRNEGVIGNILDVSDRLAYTARDAYMFAGSTILSSDFDRATPGRRVQEILQKNKLLFDTIMEISVQGDQIIFGNGEKLKDVLEIRANMHNLVYLSPYLWTREEYFGLLFQYLVEEGHLTIEQLQKGVNGQRLTINEEVINQFYQQGIIDHDPSVTYDFFDVQICDTAQQALAQLQELKLTMNPHLPIHYLKVPSFKPGTQYLTRSAGAIRPMGEVISAEDMSELQRLSQATEKHLVLYPKKEYRTHYEAYPRLYTFLCKKADEAYQQLLHTI